MHNLNQPEPDESAYRPILGLLFLAYLLSFADRIAFGLVLKPIKATLSLSDSQAGLLAGAAFAVSYALFSPLAGYIVDRHKRRAIFIFAVAFWSIATLSCGLATSLVAMAISRVGVGVGEAILHPLAVSLVGDTVETRKRPNAFAFYTSAGAFGTVALMLFGGALVHILSGFPGLALPLVGAIQPWQALFMVLAIPGLLLSMAAFRLMAEPSRQQSAHGDRATGTSSVATFMRTYPGLGIAIVFGYPLIQMCGYSVLNWMFVFFDRVHGWPAGKAGPILALTCGIMFIAGCLLSGKFIALLRKFGFVDAPLRACVIAGIGFSLFSSIALILPDPMISLIPLSIAFAFGYMPTVAIFSVISEAAPASIRASITGITTLTVGLLSNSLGPFLVGFFSDHFFHGNDGLRWAIIATAAISAVGGTVLSAGGFASYKRRISSEKQSNSDMTAVGGKLANVPNAMRYEGERP